MPCSSYADSDAAVLLLNLLLVEDNPADAELFRRALLPISDERWHVTHVEFLREAVAQLQSGSFDIIVADLHLPDARGLETITQLQAVAPNIPIIVLTGSDDEAIGLRVLRQGAQDYLVKGKIDHSLLVRAVRYAIERSQTQRFMQQQTAAIAASREGMAILNQHFEFIYMNQACAEMYGYEDPQTLVGQPWKILSVPAEQDREQVISPALRQQGHWSSEGIGRRQDNSQFISEFSLTVLSEGLMLYTVRDITKRKTAEVETQQTKVFLESVLEHLQISVLAKEAKDLRFVLCNPAAADLLGVSADEVLGKDDYDLFPREQADSFTSVDRAVLESRQILDIPEETVCVKGGENKIFHTKKMQVSLADSSLQYLLLLTEDITEKKQTEVALHQSEARFQKLAANIPGMVYQYVRYPNGSDAMIYVSPACQDLYEISPEQAQQDAALFWNRLHPEDMQRVHDEVNRSAETLEPWCSEHRIITPSGRLKWIQGTARPEQDEDGRVIWDGIAIDISDRKQAEDKILRSLEREKELNELKSHFISIVSHEFRTPLSLILSSTELLQKYGDQWTAEKKQIRFDRIVAGVQRITQLLQDALMLSEAESGRLSFNPMLLNVSEFCRNLAAELQTNFKTEHVIDLTAQPIDCLVQVDEQLLRHILTNLIANAVKYSPQHFKIHVEVNHTGTELILRVRDSGIGIPAAEQTKLFDIFYRGSNVGTICGAGLGLAIVKQCVAVHGGKIQVDSELGRGSVFTVTFPDR